MESQIIFDIDFSSKSSIVCVVIDRIKQGNSFKITNDSFGYQKLYDRLNDYLITPLVVFEATGVYSLSLQAFLEDYHIKYLKLNPLKAKKLMDNNLRHNKTDKVDAYRLALIQFNAPQKLRDPQPREYHELQNASRYYEELTRSLIVAKNQLRRDLQSTFPQIEQILSNPSGRVYWAIISMFPHAKYVLEKNEIQVKQMLDSISGVGRQRAQYLTARLYALAKEAYPYDFKDSIIVRAIQRNISTLFSLQQERDFTIDYMEKLAKSVNVTKHGNHIARKIMYRTITQMETVRAT